MNATHLILHFSPTPPPRRRTTAAARLAAALLVATSTLSPAADFADSAQYAWSENAGWLNLKDAYGGAKFYDDHLEGYVWHENLGWIRLGTRTKGSPYTYLNTNPSDYGVNRNSLSGALSGYAWSENAGWINFASANAPNGGVNLNLASGELVGYAWAENVGWVRFAPYATLNQPCGFGVAYPTGQWQQFALPCVPTSPATIGSVLGNAPDANLPTASYGTSWYLYGRNQNNSGNSYLTTTAATLANGHGYWFKSLVDPVGNRLQVTSGTATEVQTGIDGCQSANGCVVISVPTVPGTTAARMIGNPFPYNIDWSKVRVRVNGNVYTPSLAFDFSLVNKQIWIWNGASYDTWDDYADPGNLQGFKSFFIKVMSNGWGQTIDLLIPAEFSDVPVTALPTGFAERLAALPRAWGQAMLDWLFPTAAAAEALPDAGEWQVRLRVENKKSGAKTRALLGQRLDAKPGYDPADLTALAPFASPYLTLVFPQPGWGANKGDYASDFRPADGTPNQWKLELRSDTVPANLVLRWEGDPAILAHSRLIDGKRVIDPANPAYAQGYHLTLTTKVRTLTWEYLGD